MRRRGVCNWHQRGVASYDACARGKEEGGGGAACLSAQLHRRRARWSSLGGRTLLGRELTAAHLQRHGAAPQLLLLVREAVLDQPDLRRRGWGAWEACGRGVWEAGGVAGGVALVGRGRASTRGWVVGEVGAPWRPRPRARRSAALPSVPGRLPRCTCAALR